MTTRRGASPELVRLREVAAMLVGVGAPVTIRQLHIILSARVALRSEATVRGMAKHMHVQSPIVSRGLDSLQAAGLVSREADPADGRSLFVELTPPGSELVDEIERLLAAPTTTKRSDEMC